MNLNLKPIFLFADSQPLFDCPINFPQVLGINNCKAAYISFSNNDEPEYYEIFLALMEKQNIKECMHITSNYTTSEKTFLEQADLILLSGGDTEKGWKKIEEKNLPQLLLKKYSQGKIIMGVSAGAVQLGSGFRSKQSFVSTLNLLPITIDVHNEEDEWANLKSIVTEDKPTLLGIGIPLHGAMLYHADGAVEALQKPLAEFYMEKGSLKNNLIMIGEKIAGGSN
ncbi:MAG: hypothetical protein D8M58_09220 [Calditrichaeota bacterium]|nr:MAG: hypothetical protein DWQ03_17270 [Calditrichota bacterium]MBL1205566.1 hypothetical protein [Calditrichota bacterium]NOG45395.1 type 1 glutamine amidotransferase-like domain-containing protein [Calditrichota bacterium]